jgi:hypothetical protein
MQLLQALLRTLTESADSKKAFYSFAATAVLALLILHWHVDPVIAGVIVGPLVLLTGAQAHVDAQTAKAKGAPTISGPVIGELNTSAPAEKPADAVGTFETKTQI